MEQLTFSTFDLERAAGPLYEDDGRRCRHDQHPELCAACEEIERDALENDQ